MPEVTIRALKNGPLEVAGAVQVLDIEKQAYPAEPSPIYLCRCGQSANKPFCDGSHKAVGFKAEEKVGARG